MHSIQCSVPFSPFTTNIFPSMFTTTYSKRNGAYERKSLVTKRTGRGKKGKSLPKKSGGILCEGNRLEAYRFIKQHHNEFGLRWLLRRFNICPNAYYNYRKHRKADYYARREKVLSKITDIYHKHHGVTVYRSMQVYLEREGFSYSTATVHKYMNSILGLKSIVRPKKPEYEYGEPHKVFENKIQQIKSIKNGVPILPICF